MANGMFRHRRAQSCCCAEVYFYTGGGCCRVVWGDYYYPLIFFLRPAAVTIPWNTNLNRALSLSENNMRQPFIEDQIISSAVHSTPHGFTLWVGYVQGTGKEYSWFLVGDNGERLPSPAGPFLPKVDDNPSPTTINNSPVILNCTDNETFLRMVSSCSRGIAQVRAGKLVLRGGSTNWRLQGEAPLLQLLLQGSFGSRLDFTGATESAVLFRPDNNPDGVLLGPSIAAARLIVHWASQNPSHALELLSEMIMGGSFSSTTSSVTESLTYDGARRIRSMSSASTMLGDLSSEDKDDNCRRRSSSSSLCMIQEQLLCVRDPMTQDWDCQIMPLNWLPPKSEIKQLTNYIEQQKEVTLTGLRQGDSNRWTFIGGEDDLTRIVISTCSVTDGPVYVSFGRKPSMPLLEDGPFACLIHAAMRILADIPDNNSASLRLLANCRFSLKLYYSLDVDSSDSSSSTATPPTETNLRGRRKQIGGRTMAERDQVIENLSQNLDLLWRVTEAPTSDGGIALRAEAAKGGPLHLYCWPSNGEEHCSLVAIRQDCTTIRKRTNSQQECYHYEGYGFSSKELLPTVPSFGNSLAIFTRLASKSVATGKYRVRWRPRSAAQIVKWGAYWQSNKDLIPTFSWDSMHGWFLKNDSEPSFWRNTTSVIDSNGSVWDLSGACPALPVWTERWGSITRTQNNTLVYSDILNRLRVVLVEDYFYGETLPDGERSQIYPTNRLHKETVRVINDFLSSQQVETCTILPERSRLRLRSASGNRALILLRKKHYFNKNP